MVPLKLVTVGTLPFPHFSSSPDVILYELLLHFLSMEHVYIDTAVTDVKPGSMRHLLCRSIAASAELLVVAARASRWISCSAAGWSMAGVTTEMTQRQLDELGRGRRQKIN